MKLQISETLTTCLRFTNFYVVVDLHNIFLANMQLIYIRYNQVRGSKLSLEKSPSEANLLFHAVWIFNQHIPACRKNLASLIWFFQVKIALSKQMRKWEDKLAVLFPMCHFFYKIKHSTPNCSIGQYIFTEKKRCQPISFA